MEFFYEKGRKSRDTVPLGASVFELINKVLIMKTCIFKHLTIYFCLLGIAISQKGKFTPSHVHIVAFVCMDIFNQLSHLNFLVIL